MSNNNSFDYGTLFDEDNDPVVDVDVDELDELVDIESITTQDDDGYTLPLHVISEQEEKSVNQLIHGSYRVDSALARDVAYLADIDLDYVLSSHNITREELMEKLKQTHFKKLVRKFQDEIGEDGSGMLKVRANAYLDGGIGRLNEIIMDSQLRHFCFIIAFKEVTSFIRKNLWLKNIQSFNCSINNLHGYLHKLFVNMLYNQYHLLVN